MSSRNILHRVSLQVHRNIIIPHHNVAESGGDRLLFVLEEIVKQVNLEESIFIINDVLFQRPSPAPVLDNMITATDMFGITELTWKHSSRIPGFNVRLGWCNGKPSINAEFAIKDYESRGKALHEAVLFRDKQLLKLKKEGKWPVDKSRTKPLKNNKSGVLGVSRTPQWGRSGPSKDIFVWQACWRDSVTKKAVSVKFSEKKWGEEIAFEMACACREAKENIYKGMR